MVSFGDNLSCSRSPCQLKFRGDLFMSLRGDVSEMLMLLKSKADYTDSILTAVGGTSQLGDESSNQEWMSFKVQLLTWMCF